MANITVAKKKSLSEIQVAAKEVIQRIQAPTKSQVVAVFDVSGSMEDFYRSGIIDALATRVLGLGLELDDNGVIPVYALGDGVHRLDDLKASNIDGYVKKLHEKVGGGTNYAPTINKVVDDAEEGDPMLVLVFTDGDNFDHDEAEDALVRASKLPIFFQWYGIYRGSRATKFPFLEEVNDLGDERSDLTVDNCGFSPLGLDIVDSTNNGNDDTKLYEDMLKEYKDFPTKAKDAGATWSNKSKIRRRSIFGISF